MIPPSARVLIEDHVLTGSRMFILPGVRMGHHALIGACSVVTKDIPPHNITMGNPAQIIGGAAHYGGNLALRPHSYCAH